MRTNTCKRTWYTRREVKRKGHKKVDEHEDTGDEISGERLIESTHVSWAKCKRVLYCQPTSITTYRPLLLFIACFCFLLVDPFSELSLSPDPSPHSTFMSAGHHSALRGNPRLALVDECSRALPTSQFGAASENFLRIYLEILQNITTPLLWHRS